MDGSHKADRVGKIGTEKQQVAVALGDGVDDGLEIFGRQRIGGLMDDTEAVLLGIGLRAKNRVAGEFGIR